jgi:hypothetical protein
MLHTTNTSTLIPEATTIASALPCARRFDATLNPGSALALAARCAR